MTKTENNSELLSHLDADAMARRQVLHEQGLLLTSAQLCERLGISRQALGKAVKGKRLFAVDGTNGARWYPSFFITDLARRREIERVSLRLDDLPGDVKWRFFIAEKHSLAGRTPLRALGDGDVDQVLSTAAEFRERNIGRFSRLTSRQASHTRRQESKASSLRRQVLYFSTIVGCLTIALPQCSLLRLPPLRFYAGT